MISRFVPSRFLPRFAPFVMLVAGVTAMACSRTGSRSTDHDAAAAPPASSTYPSDSLTPAIPPEDPSVKFGKAFARRLLEGANVPDCAWSVVRADQVVAEGGCRASSGRDRASDADANMALPEVFEAASIAKPIVATTVMQLVEAGRLDLDADVDRYLPFHVVHPGFPRTPITLRMLLSHTSGIVDPVDALAHATRDVPLERHLREVFLTDGKLRADRFGKAAPGSAVRYSNVGVTLAAFAVERVSGVPFESHAERAVFAPLGMLRTTYARATDETTDATHPHRSVGTAFVPLPHPSHALYPIVDLRATASDLGRFARAILRGGELDGRRILSKDGVRLMLRPTSGAGHADGEPSLLGWQRRTFDMREVVGHEGEDEGASTALFLDFDAGTGVVLLTNGDAFASSVPSRTRAMAEAIDMLFARADVVSSR